MNNAILKEMEILWSSFEKFDVDQKLEAFQRLKESATKEDLPVLLDFLRSERNDFWIRELLAEPICDLVSTDPNLYEVSEPELLRMRFMDLRVVAVMSGPPSSGPPAILASFVLVLFPPNPSGGSSGL